MPLRTGTAALMFTLAAALGACQSLPWRPPATESRGFLQVGLASWYGPGFQDHRTADGRRFNMNGLNAAHRTLPMNSLVRVTNLENGRSVVVRINDRGPYIAGRIIDLSRAAARALGMKKDGLARVRIERVPERVRERAAGS
ncbi:MAG TPA: septal ring lytic transglycosylase RlpA family protein [Candidatus Binataceae bacterium]|nr:septal ring lytic transglycosylase RlpA family protein [Candidatus Binataceae bacterium]